MKAVQFSRFGAAADVAEVVDLPDPGPPRPGEVVLDILATKCGLLLPTSSLVGRI